LAFPPVPKRPFAIVVAEFFLTDGSVPLGEVPVSLAFRIVLGLSRLSKKLGSALRADLRTRGNRGTASAAAHELMFELGAALRARGGGFGNEFAALPTFDELATGSSWDHEQE
jgi:hypothetical protein